MQITLSEKAHAVIEAVQLPGENDQQTIERVIENIAPYAEDYAHVHGAQQPNTTPHPEAEPNAYTVRYGSDAPESMDEA